MVTWLVLGLVTLATDAAPPEAGKVPLRGEIVDADTGRPIAARVYLQAEDGTWFFPESVSPEGSAVPYRKVSFNDKSIVEMHTTLSAHPFVARVPAGRYNILVERGKEYLPQSETVTVADEPVQRTIKLRRWVNSAERGWYSGETHTHRSLDELPNLMLAEDLNVTFPLTDWVREAFIPPVARRDPSYRDPGADPIRIDPTHVIFPRNTEYEIFAVGREAHTLGAFFVLNHKTELDLGVPPVGPLARRAHREGALIELDKHNWPWSMMLVPVMGVDLYELANNHVWRTTFGIRAYGEQPAEYMRVERDARGWTERGWIEFGLQNYYALLDCGFRLRPTAGTASGVHPVPLGFGRVYVRLGGRFDGEAWLRGLNEGRSFVTTGPMLFVTLDGHDPGHRFTQTGPERRSYHLAGSALSAQPLKPIEVVRNGEVLRTIESQNRKTDRGAFESPIDVEIPIEGTAWLAVRCFEDRPDHRPRFAHSAPFFIDVAGRPLRPRREEVEYLIQRVESQLARIARLLPEPAVEEYREALKVYRKMAESAK